MDETAKTKCRNGISAIGYFLITILGVFFTIGIIANMAPNTIFLIVIEILVGIAGVILLVLKKRDLTAIVFLMFATLFSYYTVTGGVRFSPVTYVLCWLFILVPIALLFSGEKKAKTYFCVFFPYGIGAVIYGFCPEATIFNIIMHSIFTLVALFTGILYVAEKVKTPMATSLRADENVQFSRAGPALGFYLLAVFCAITTVSIFMNLMTTDIFESLALACGISLTAISIIIAIFTRLRIEALLVLIAGISIMLLPIENTLFADGGFIFSIVTGILFILFAIIMMIWRKRALGAIMFILIGVFFLSYNTGILSPTVGAVLLGIAALIGIYLKFALVKQKPLPTF